MPDYLRTDAQTDVLVSLNEFLRQLGRVKEDRQAWKFAIVALMFATNGALVYFLSGTMQIGALKEGNAEMAIKALEKDSGLDIPEPFLAAPSELLKRARGLSRRFDTRNEILTVPDEHVKNFEKILKFRNQLNHFSPQVWLIELYGLPRLCSHCIEIIDLVHAEGWAFRHLETEDGEGLT